MAIAALYCTEHYCTVHHDFGTAVRLTDSSIVQYGVLLQAICNRDALSCLDGRFGIVIVIVSKRNSCLALLHQVSDNEGNQAV